MGVMQTCKIAELRRELEREKKKHEVTQNRLDAALKQPVKSNGEKIYDFSYLDAYGVRIPKKLTYKQAEDLTEWMVTRHLAGRCSRCGYTTDDPRMFTISLKTDGLICNKCGAEMLVLEAPAPPEPWGTDGRWVVPNILDPLGSIWVGLQNKYPEFGTKCWAKRHKYDPEKKRLREDIKNLRKRIKQLECPHGITEIKVRPVTFRDIQTDSTYIKDVACKTCKLCGKELSQLSEAAHLALLIDDFIGEEVSDGNGVIKSIEKLREANERLRVAISDAAPDA